MAEIDSLELNIEVKENNATKIVHQFSNAIKELQKSLAGLKDVQKQLTSLQDVFKGIGNLKVSAPKTSEFNEELATKQEKVQHQINLTKQKINDQTLAWQKMRDKGSNAAKELEKNIIRAKKELQEQNKELKNSVPLWKKIAAALGRIALYRAIRAALKEITQSAKEGLENVRKIDKELDTALNRISLAGISIKDSFAIVLSSIIKVLEPQITALTDRIANFINKLSEAQAVVSGKNSFVKIITSDMQEYEDELKKAQKETGKLLNFDTFTTLSVDKKDNTYTGIKESPVGMSSEEATKTLSVLDKIMDVIKSIGEIIRIIVNDFIKPVIIPFVKKVLPNLLNIIKNLSKILIPLLSVGTKLLSWILYGVLKVAEGIINAVVLAINTVIDLINLLFTPLDEVLKMIGMHSIKLSRLNTVKFSIEAPKFANGGQFNSADMFYANENGRTELIASNNNGGGAVMNLDQWASISYSSFYRALSDYNAAKDGGRGIDMNQLGKAVASNSGFIGEINRRNTGVKLI